MRYPSYDRLKTQLQLRMVEKGSRPQGKFAITTHRKDNVRAVDVPLSVEAIGQLGLYASLRDMGLVELIAQVLGEAVKKDLVGKILDDIPPKPSSFLLCHKFWCPFRATQQGHRDRIAKSSAQSPPNGRNRIRNVPFRPQWRIPSGDKFRELQIL